MSMLLLSLPGNEAIATSIAAALGAQIGRVEQRKFPDEETYLRLDSDVNGLQVVIVCTLDRPDNKILPLLFLAATARELGAERVGLLAPYLAYMRQDRRFNPGEAVTSRQFARLISESFDWLVTVDPHLHRYNSLSEIYSIPTKVVHAAPLISDWIRSNVSNPLIIGPDSESEQWVSAVAGDAGAPYTVLQKLRHGDRDVEITIRNPHDIGGRTPVLVDDIISSGRTMIEATKLIAACTSGIPHCIAVHGIFADSSDALLAKAGARVITCNSIPHETNAIDIAPLLIQEIQALAGE
ncbi:ribose-phosphate pyrophosphokinase [Bradyrhizobium yuanmingense]|uniref:ribose-phosphate pyrophosphokinase n=1 Tax=Bradyrhizobium yuanmingense TaxID=108015 RepID=UPI001CD2F3A7|nr:ribose-phosphate pyrophosphokinase [Bradyrhizobium yuanmingense]MCA1529069.1 ribose-phosphate pyrophosphokinase [Bradyrhizobium yuanmingense]